MQEKDNNNPGMYLLRKSHRGILRLIFSRTFLVVILLLLQVLLQVSFLFWFKTFLPHYYIIVLIYTVMIVLYLINSSIDPSAKITWLVIMMILPFLGAVLFGFTQSNLGHRVLKKKLDQTISDTMHSLDQDEETWADFSTEHPAGASLAKYVNRSGCFPVYERTNVTYFPSGEAKFQAMLAELEKAEHFIFLEYFIIAEGTMWGQVLEILARKAQEGVDVRLMYDGNCEFFTLPHNYPEKIRALGIKCKVFAPLAPVLSTHYNYRDHRKILVIDGHTAFNGGVNLADEYINHIERFGHWKDTAVMLKGDAVPSFTLMFLQMWNVSEKSSEFAEFLQYPLPMPPKTKGFVMPYGDCPLDSDKVGERVYMDILNRAQKYVHIMTPYLILDGELEAALKFAAERGVEVCLILPGIPDKTIPYALSKGEYKTLLESGVHIYEYTPGFVHAKTFISDDCEAVVGTINLDYRSLYHHFECATYMYNTECIAEIEQDFQDTLQMCCMVDKKTIWQHHGILRVINAVMKAIGPLL